VKGFAENLEDGSVKVICEGEEEGIKELINSIKEDTEKMLGKQDTTIDILRDVKDSLLGAERKRRECETMQKASAKLKSFLTTIAAISFGKSNYFLYLLQNKCSLCVKKFIHIRKLFM